MLSWRWSNKLLGTVVPSIVTWFVKWSPEISRPENNGLSAALDLLVEAEKEIDSYSKGGPISFADLIQFAGALYFWLVRSKDALLAEL
jgi:hypothetical protein